MNWLVIGGLQRHGGFMNSKCKFILEIKMVLEKMVSHNCSVMFKIDGNFTSRQFPAEFLLVWPDPIWVNRQTI